MHTKAPTMKDVAELAGVSVQTVSCVVNGTGTISPKTQARVLKAIKQLRYRRDPIARSMRTRQTRLVGLLVLDITNPVLSVIASAVEAAAHTEDYKVILYNVSMNPRRERECLETSAEGLVDGLIIVNTVDPANTLTFLQEEAISAVLIDCQTAPDIPCVAVDNVQAAYMAASHAIERGHRRIAHITGSSTLLMAHQREQGYLQALDDHDLAYRRVLVSPDSRWDYRAGYSTTQQLLRGSDLPTAIFAASDQMAIGACRAISEAGLKVPDDISVIGFDDIEAAAFATPPLTTIRQPFVEIARTAFNLLMQVLSGEHLETTQIVLPPELIVRQSVKELK